MNREVVRKAYFDLVIEYKEKQLILSQMMGSPFCDESTVLSCAEKALREKYDVSDSDMKVLREEASGLASFSKRIAEQLFR